MKSSSAVPGQFKFRGYDPEAKKLLVNLRAKKIEGVF